MKFLKIKILILSFLLLPAIQVFSQTTTEMPERTPEQEAAKQTEKLQQELDLNTEQTRLVNEINLKYARARQSSNSRIEAMQRIKDKDNDLRRVLTGEQYTRLQNKRYERSAYRSSELLRNEADVRPAEAGAPNREYRNVNQGADQERQVSRDENTRPPSTERRSVQQFKSGSPLMSRNPYQSSFSAPRSVSRENVSRESSVPADRTTRSSSENRNTRTAAPSYNPANNTRSSEPASRSGSVNSSSPTRSSSGSTERSGSGRK
jgi:hypothetical protein